VRHDEVLGGKAEFQDRVKPWDWIHQAANSAFLLVRRRARVSYPATPSMTWIKTVPLSEASEQLLRALESQRPLYPKEYATPVFRSDDEVAGIVASHSLIPDALFHAFSTFGVLMSPELPSLVGSTR
jgi:hypothetical protein